MPAVVVLVVGFDVVDSGKTTLAASLARALASSGFDVGVSKPVGGVDLWHSPWVLGETERLGLVVSGDALSLARMSEVRDALEEVNPLAFYLAPLDPSRHSWRRASLDAVAGDPARRTVYARVTACRGGSRETAHAVNLEALERLPGAWAERLEGLAGRLRPPLMRGGDELMTSLMGTSSLAAADSCLSTVLERHEVVVVESQSDAAAPTPLSAAADLVVAVAPGKAALVDGDRYAKALNVAGAMGAPHLYRAPEAVHLARPSLSLDLPPLEDPRTGYPPDSLEAIVEAVRERAGVS